MTDKTMIYKTMIDEYYIVYPLILHTTCTVND